MSRLSRQIRPEWAEISQREFREIYKQLSSILDLASLWKVDAAQLNYYAHHIDKREAYRTFGIPRRNGQVRLINAPVRTLECFQRLLHESLTRVYEPASCVHGFLNNRSIITNAKHHLHSRYVLNIDLQDFFPSITRKRIFGRLIAGPYSFHIKVANLIAALSTNFYDQLPQGSPSSPVIANIIAAGLDTEITKICGSLGCRYTRYADDITISKVRGELPPDIARYPNARSTDQVVIGDTLANVIHKHGFKINHSKSRLQSYWTRQMCTGLVVNGDQISPPRVYIRRLRSLIDHWQKKGWQDAAQVLHIKENRRFLTDRQKLMDHVMGRIAYLKMVRGIEDPLAQQFGQIIASIPHDH